MFAFIGGGSSIPGLTPDNLSPAGINVAGGVISNGGNGFIVVVSSNNGLTVQDHLGNVLAAIDSTGKLVNAQVSTANIQIAGTVDQVGQAVIIPQTGQADPTFLIMDDTGTIFEIFADTSNVLHSRNGFASFAGGIGLFNHAIPGSQPTATLVTSTITDANAKAAIKELITIVNGCGLATITET